jgi:hypothetical protein
MSENSGFTLRTNWPWPCSLQVWQFPRWQVKITTKLWQDLAAKFTVNVGKSLETLLGLPKPKLTKTMFPFFVTQFNINNIFFHVQPFDHNLKVCLLFVSLWLKMIQASIWISCCFVLFLCWRTKSSSFYLIPSIYA